MSISEMLEYEINKDIHDYKRINGLSYTKEQYGVIKRAIDSKFTDDQMKYLMRPDLPAFQLEEVRFAIKGGVQDPNQIKLLLTPGLMSWQLDILRVGFENNLNFDKVKELACIDSNYEEFKEINRSSQKWAERKHEITVMARQANNHPIRSLVNSLENNLDNVTSGPSDCPVQLHKQSQIL